MKWCGKLWFFGSPVILVVLMFTTCECKTVTSRALESTSDSASSPEKSNGNVLLSFAKGIASQALSEFQESARRNPKLGFNITLPMVVRQGDTAAPTPAGGIPGLPNIGLGGMLGTSAKLGLLGIKGSLLIAKAALIELGVLVIFVIFLLAGIAYFACNIGVISCSNLGGGLGNFEGGGGGGGLGQAFAGANPFSRTGYDFPHGIHRTTSAVYNGIDEVRKKFT